MNRRLPPLLAAAFLVSCGPPPPREARETRSVHLDKKPDGLSYTAGSNVPFTGEVVFFTARLGRQAVETYQNGLPHGLWQRFWSNGKLNREDRYELGAMVHERQWYEDGVPKRDCEMKNGVPFGKMTLWWPDGRLQRTSLIGGDQKPHGQVLEYAVDGTLLTDAIFHRGQYVSGKLRKDPTPKPVTAQAN
jgi:hypothetical protein